MVLREQVVLRGVLAYNILPSMQCKYKLQNDACSGRNKQWYIAGIPPTE